MLVCVVHGGVCESFTGHAGHPPRCRVVGSWHQIALSFFLGGGRCLMPRVNSFLLQLSDEEIKSQDVILI